MLENKNCNNLEQCPMDGGAWKASVHGVAEGRTWLTDFTFHFHALEKEMATHSSVLAWRIPGTGEPGGLPSMGSQRVGHDWSDSAAACTGTSVLTAVLFTKTKIRQQCVCPRIHERVKKWWCVCTMEYYSATKKNKIWPFMTIRLDLEGLF